MENNKSIEITAEDFGLQEYEYEYEFSEFNDQCDNQWVDSYGNTVTLANGSGPSSYFDGYFTATATTTTATTTTSSDYNWDNWDNSGTITIT